MSAEQAAAAFDAGTWLEEATNKGWRPKDDAAVAKRGKDALAEFARQVTAGETVSEDARTTINTMVAEIDKKLSAQLNEIMHHPDYQRLEGTWRGMHYLVHKSETGEKLKLRVFNAKKNEVLRDLQKAKEFDMSHLFKRVYTEEYGQLGGFPYGMLVGDFDFNVANPQDMKLLSQMSGLAAMAHAPFVASASPETFNMESYTKLGDPRDLAAIFSTPEYAPWQSFRESEDSRYVALTLPRVLARLPYGEKFVPAEVFNFEEDVSGKDHDKYQWMSSSWAYAARITEAAALYGWMAKTRGVEGGGKVEDLPVHTFPTDDGEVVMKCPTEIAIPDRRENELSNLGFLPLLHCKGRDFAAFLGAQSCQKPKKYDTDYATANAALSAKFNLIMCVSRFAHFLKVMVRNKIGSFMERADMEKWLNRWINNYTIDESSAAIASDETKAAKPLLSARVEVQDVPGQPGWYRAQAYMRPHFQLEGADISLRLVAQQLSQ